MSPTAPSRTLGLALGLLGLVALFACGGAPAEPVQSYHVRGLVEEVTGKGEEARASIHHELVPAFKDRDGNAADMPPMVMIFGMAPGVSLAAGDKIEFDFDVRWSKQPALLVTKAKKLPADTKLALPDEGS